MPKHDPAIAGAIVSIVVTITAALTGAGAAHATSDEPKPRPSASERVITEAVPGTTTVVTHAGTTAAGITLPGTASDAAVAPGPRDLPAGLFTGVGTPVLSTALTEARLSSYSTGTGTQTLIGIDSASADHEYRFPLSLPSGSWASLEADGSVSIRNMSGDVVGGFKTPWAYDSHGKPVPTRFFLDGDALVQRIDFDEGTAFPVTADPSDFWGWSKCVATVTAEIAANALVAGKVAKLVARFGSIQRTFQILFRAWNAASSWTKKWQAVAAAGGGLATEILGITSIKEACFDS